MITIAFDIDGTVLDVWGRYWGLYATYVKSQGVVPVTYDTYCAEVRKGIKNISLFEKWHDRTLYHKYIVFRNSRLELSDSLRQDSIIPGMAAVLKSLAGHLRLIAVSARDDADNLQLQLGQLGLAPLFAAVHATKLYGGGAAKAHVLQEEGAKVIVGDTEVDVQAALEAGVFVMPVTWGLRNAVFLRSVTSAPIFNSPNQLVDVCLALCTVTKTGIS